MALSSSIKQFQTLFESQLNESLLSANVADDLLMQAMSYSLLLGGKRVRPYLAYVTGKMLGAAEADLMRIGVAMEAIHTYSLIHDDLPAMDDDELRRGQPTCHQKFDEATAILAGDTLQSFAFSTLSNQSFEQVSAPNQLKIISLIADSATKMCAGQSIDLQNTDNHVGLNELQNMHALKTGALIEASVLAGAIAGNADDKELAALKNYARAIGLAFQVWDDVLDITSDTQTLGKPQGSDQASNKATYPSHLGLEETKTKAQNLIHEAIESLTVIAADTTELKQLAQYIIERDH